MGQPASFIPKEGKPKGQTHKEFIDSLFNLPNQGRSLEPRAEAASKMIRQNVKRQAGTGQISYVEEREAR